MTEYKGYTIVPFEWYYGEEKNTAYEIHKQEDNNDIIYYKDNGVTPKTATLGDTLWDSIEQAKEDIDKDLIIKGGVFATDKDGHTHWATFKAVGNLWYCGGCDREFFDKKVKPYAETDEYGLLCKECFNRLIKHNKEVSYKLKPKEYITFKNW